MPILRITKKQLAADLPSFWHVADTWENYDRLDPVITRRYEEWKNPPKNVGGSFGSSGRAQDARVKTVSTPESQRRLDWVTRLQAIAQNGLTFARDAYDIERYQAVREVAAEMLAAKAGVDLGVVRNLLSLDSGYATPKVDVRGVVFRDDKLLMVRERSDGGWTLPGGWADVCESPAENVVREVFEESGFQTRAVKVLAIFDRSKHPHEPAFPYHVYKIFILCDALGGTETPSSETDAVGFFGEVELPELSVSRVTSWQIHRMFEHHRAPHLPTDFDPIPSP